jgi:hypothetical protein
VDVLAGVAFAGTAAATGFAVSAFGAAGVATGSPQNDRAASADASVVVLGLPADGLPDFSDARSVAVAVAVAARGGGVSHHERPVAVPWARADGAVPTRRSATTSHVRFMNVLRAMRR